MSLVTLSQSSQLNLAFAPTKILNKQFNQFCPSDYSFHTDNSNANFHPGEILLVRKLFKITEVKNNLKSCFQFHTFTKSYFCDADFQKRKKSLFQLENPHEEST